MPRAVDALEISNPDAHAESSGRRAQRRYLDAVLMGPGVAAVHASTTRRRHHNLHRISLCCVDRWKPPTNDAFWDKVVEITSIGEQDAYAVTVAGTHNVVAQGILVLAA